jgi:hypothetical protein
MSRSFTLAAITLAAGAATLSACVVVPLDPRTGQPYPYAGAPTSNVTVISPPASPPAPAVLTARLYPLNEAASRAGMLTAVVVNNHTGRGNFSVGFQGDTLQGEATRVDGGYAAFGRIHNEVLGLAPRAFSGQRGIANGYGPKGMSVQCEYLLTAPATGTGACLFSDGARYQMHFGG